MSFFIHFIFTQTHPIAKDLLNKPFLYYDQLSYVFGKNRAMEGRAETFANIGSNDPSEYERFQPHDGNNMDIPTINNQGLTCCKRIYELYDLVEHPTIE